MSTTTVTVTVVARTSGLTKIYGTGDTAVRALDGVDVTIEAGRASPP